MEPRTCDAVLVCPTLNIEGAARMLAEARQTAGMDCGIVLASDYGRRGALVVGNVLLRAAQDWGARWVAYLNDDIGGFQEGWLRRMVEAVESNPRYGTAVAGCHCRTKPQCDGRPGLSPAVVETHYPTAWVCAVIKREVLQSVGALDEELRHYGDDTDFELRMRSQGWLAVWVQDVYVEHAQAGWDDVWYAEDKRYLKRKWGQI